MRYVMHLINYENRKSVHIVFRTSFALATIVCQDLETTGKKYLGIEIDESKLHDAEYDIKICIQIFNKL